MSFTYELFFQIFNTILIVAIPVLIYKLIKKLVSNIKLINKRLDVIEKKIDNIK